MKMDDTKWFSSRPKLGVDYVLVVDLREAHLKEKLPRMQAEIERMHECLDLVLDAKSLSEAKSAAIVGLPTEHSKEGQVDD